MEVSTTSHKLSALQAELDAKENDAQTQRQQKEQAGKYEERLRALNTEIRTLRKRQNEYTQPSLSLGPAPNPPTSHPTSPLYRYNVDHDRIYAVGMSNGGGFAALLGCRMPEQFRAIASVAGAYYPGTYEGCAEGPVAFLEIHGGKDGVISI